MTHEPLLSYSEAMALDIHRGGDQLAVGNDRRPRVMTMRELGAMRFPPIKWVVPGLIVEGLTILAGRPKLGKSWLVLDIALAVARGSYCLGEVLCETGDVLYLALEDNHRRLQNRVDKITPAQCPDKWPERMTIAFSWSRADAGGVDDVREWIEEADNPRLVVIDVLAQFRSARGDRDSLYESDYNAVKHLQELASEHDLAIIIVHHTRKGTWDGDPFEKVSGTLGLTGAADSTLVLDRDSSGATLYGRGRDIEEIEKAVQFNPQTCRWTVLGEATEVRRTDERGALLAELLDAVEPLGPSDLAAATGMKTDNVRNLLRKMMKAGEVMKARYGRYVHPQRTGLLPKSDPQTPGHTGHTDHTLREEDR